MVLTMKKRLIVVGLLLVVSLLAACSISKYTDLSSKPNLLLGTNNGTKNYSLGDNGYNATLAAEGDGVKVIMESHNDNGWLVLQYNDGQSKDLLSGPEGEEYILAFEVKSNIKNAKVAVSHKQGDAKECQIDFGEVIIDRVDKWEQFTLKGQLYGVDATSQVLYFDLRNNPAGTEISIRNLKLVRIADS